MTDEAALSDCVSFIHVAYPATQAVYLYGTWGTGFQRRGSDIDLAVLLPHEEAIRVDGREWFSLSVEIAARVHVEHADLVNLRRADTSLQAEVLKTGRLVDNADDDARLRFETLVLSMHQRLNRERAGIRKEIIASGRVFAQ